MNERKCGVARSAPKHIDEDDDLLVRFCDRRDGSVLHEIRVPRKNTERIDLHIDAPFIVVGADGKRHEIGKRRAAQPREESEQHP